MNAAAEPLDRPTAAEYASWFRALADPTRIQIVSLLARRGGPMNVGQIVAAVEVGQSTVSAHLKVLAEVRFVLAERRGTATFYRVNEACVECFPTAADIVMGKPVPSPDGADEVIGRYSGLARTVRAGRQVTDGPEETSRAVCFGAAAYDDTSDLPDGAVMASLGCGNPVAVAALHPGETVLDLGSGGGIDVLLSARRVGPGGQAYGLDGSPDMLALARDNAARAGVTNAEFLAGRIEAIPLPAASVDVIISNCVINLSADKPRVLAEAFRVLRPGGRIGVSDLIIDDGLDAARLAEAQRLTGCAAGTLTAASYRRHLLAAGFTGIAITATSEAAPGLHSAIIQASRPVAPLRQAGHPGPERAAAARPTGR